MDDKDRPTHRAGKRRRGRAGGRRGQGGQARSTSSGASKSGESESRVLVSPVRRPALPAREVAAQVSGDSESPRLVPDLFRYWQVVRNRRALVLGIFAVVVLGVAAGTAMQDPVYRATGTIEIRRASDDVVPVEQMFELARISDQYLETQYNLLRSPTLVRRVAADLRLYEVDEFLPDDGPREAPPDVDGDGGEPNADWIWRIVNEFDDRLSVHPVEGSRLVEISFEAGDPELAARIVNSVAENYVELREEAAHEALQRLATQADGARENVSAAERQLQDLVGATDLLYVEGGSGEIENVIGGRIHQLHDQLTQAEAELFMQEARYAQIRGGDHGTLDSEVLQMVNVKIAELEGEYARLRAIFTDDYPRTRQVKRQVEALKAEAERERNRMAAEIRRDYQAAVRRRQLLQQAIEDQKQLLDRFADEAAEYRILKRDVEAQQEIYLQLRQKVKEAGVSAALAAIQVLLVDPAIAPQDPIRPSTRRNLALAMIMGLLLGIGAAFVREYADPRINSVEEVDAMADVPILAMIPRAAGVRRPHRIPALARSGGWQLAAPVKDDAPQPVPWVRIDQQDWQRSALSDAFGTLRTSVLFESQGPQPRSLVVTSVRAGEGKTTIAINLALSLARLDRRVLLVDADIRRPSVHRAFSLRPSPGLAEYLEGGVEGTGIIRSQPRSALEIMPAGRTDEDPSVLLSSERLRALLDHVESEYDFVLIDSPALLVNVADARILAPLADGIVLVVRSGVTPRELLKRILRHTPNVVGLVMNDLHSSIFSSYYQDYPREEEEPDDDSWLRTVPRAVRKLWRAEASDQDKRNPNIEIGS